MNHVSARFRQESEVLSHAARRMRGEKLASATKGTGSTEANMMTGHIAFIVLPQPSQLYPTLPIVSVLVRRGYRVTYATSPRFSSEVDALGAEVIASPAFSVTEFFQQQRDATSIHELPHCIFARRTLAKISNFYEENRPDLIFYDVTSLAGRILASRLGVPAIHITPTFALNRRSLGEQVGDPEYRRRLVEMSDNADSFLSRNGRPSRDFLFHREKLNIYIVPEMLQPPGDVFGEEMLYASRCPAEQRIHSSWHPPREKDRLIALVTASTSWVQGAQYFKMCMESLAALPWHIVLSIGETGNPESIGALPPHVEIVQRVSHLNILPHASVLLCQGGTVTACEAAYHGVPLLVMSQGVSELEWLGANIARVGVGIHLDKEMMSIENVRSAAITLTKDSSIKNRVRELQRAVQHSPGAEEVANRVEQYIEECYCSRR